MDIKVPKRTLPTSKRSNNNNNTRSTEVTAHVHDSETSKIEEDDEGDSSSDSSSSDFVEVYREGRKSRNSGSVSVTTGKRAAAAAGGMTSKSKMEESSGNSSSNKRVTRSAANNNNVGNKSTNSSNGVGIQKSKKVTSKEKAAVTGKDSSKGNNKETSSSRTPRSVAAVAKELNLSDDDDEDDFEEVTEPATKSTKNNKKETSSKANTSVSAAATSAATKKTKPAKGKESVPVKKGDDKVEKTVVPKKTNKSTNSKLSDSKLQASTSSASPSPSKSKKSPPSTLKAVEDAVDRRKKLDAMDVMSLLTIGEAIGGNSSGRTMSVDETMNCSDDDDEDSSEDENDWEEVAGGHHDDVGGPSQIPAEGVVVHLKGEGHQFNKKKGKKKFDLNDYLRKELNRKTREIQLYMHKTSLLCLLARGIMVNGWLRDEELMGIAFSLLPPKFSKAPKFVNLEYLSKFVAWFRIHFKVKVWDSAEAQVDEDNVDLVENLKQEMLTKNFSTHDNLVYVFIILLRAVKVDSRFMWSIQPLPLKPNTDELLQKPKELADDKSEDEDDEAVKDQPSTSKSQKGKKRKEDKEDSSVGRKIISSDDDDSDFDDKKKIKKGKHSKKKKPASAESNRQLKLTQDTWAEVYLNEEERWVSVDLNTSKILCDAEIEKKATQPVLYVLAFDNKGKVKDLTRKYAKNWLTYTLKQRVDGDWWDDTLQPFMGKATQRDIEEDEFLDEHLLSQPIPKTLSECKSHPMYVHKRHFLQYEALYPPDAAPVGFIKSEPIYSRDNVKTLRKRELWMRDAKVVKIGETPYKIIKKTKWDRANRQILKDQPLELFGEWQTEDYVPPEAKDGKVPRNEYGNVEMFKDKMLPKGCVHMRLPQLNRVAKKLNIDCAPALTDFEYSRAGCHPVYDGYVVCEEFEEILYDAWKEDQDQQKKKEEEKRIARIRGNWRRLYKAVIIHERMKKKYPDAFKKEAGPKRKLETQQASEAQKPKKRKK